MATPGASPFVATPLSAQRRSARRSWFDTPPATKLELAVEQPPSPIKTMNSRSKRRSIDDVETLILTHFTKPPRISFGKIIVGRSKTRILLVQNPAEYEQEVVIERFPHKKGFNVDQTHFVVGPEGVVSLTLTWTPHEAGGCREMVLFHVNDVYRLQAFLFGTADDPKPVKKGRKGMLGARKRQPPTCVVQTKSLKNIQDSYSPRRSVELRELRSQVKPTHALHFDQENMQPPDLEEVIPQTPPPLESTAICKSDDRNDQKAMERRKSGFLSKMSPIPRMTDTNNGIMESYAQFQTPVLDGKGGERSPLKTMSGNDNGMRSSNSPNKHGNSRGGENSRDSSQTSKQRGESRNKSSGSRDNSQTGQKSDTSSKDKPGKASLRREIPAVREAKMHVSPNSFLNDSMAAQTVATTPEVGQIRLSAQVSRVAALAKVSPSSFLEDMGSAKAEVVARKQSIPSPSSVLNDSIPHDIMVRQLEFVRRSLHEGSFSGVPTPTSSAGVKGRAVSKQPPRPMKMDRVSELARPKKRNVFANAQQQNGPAKKEKFLQRKIHERARFAKITDAPSPRRKTFLVKKQPAGKVSPVKVRLQSTTGRKDAGKGVTRQVTHNHQNAKPKTLTETSSLMTTAGETESKEKAEDSEHPCITTATSSHDDEANNLDDTMTRKRRSLWASPAVVGFEPHIMASRPDCDSTGEETQTRENTPAQMSKDEMSLQGDSLLLLCHPHLQVQSDANKSHGHQSSPDKTTAATNNRQSSGRRLFPDVCKDLSQSSDFKPLWAGTATVTKDRPSISPHLSGSGNTSKKLFPDISVDNGSGATSYTTPVQSNTKGNGNIKHDSLSSTTGDHEREQHHSSDNKSKAVRSENAPQSGGGHSFEFSSTPQLTDSPASGSEASRRATLTVTKFHPSKALLESSSNSQVEKVVPEVKVNLVEEEEEEEEVWHTDTVVIDMRNSVIIGVKMMTPSRLPTTPTSENSRRSTHAIRNPVVLDKDGLIPKNLFPAVAETDSSDMQQGDKLGDTWTETAKDAAEASSIAQNDREQNDTHISQKDLPVAAADQRLSVSSVFTERVEHHLQSDRITVTRSTAKFAAVVIVPDDSVSSLEISGDSLETGKRTSISRGKADITDDKDDDDASQRVRSESESWYDDDLVIPENSDAQSQRTERSLSTGSVFEETRLGSPTDQTDSSCPEVTPLPSSTAGGSEVKVVCPSKPEATNPDSPDRTPDAKLTTAQPILSHTIVKETLLKDAELSQTRTAVASSSHAENSNNQHRSSSQGQSQGQLRRSLSAEFRSKASHPPKAVKPPASFNVGSTKLSNLRTRSVSAIHTQGQTITKTRSQSSLDPEKQPERLGKKRSSPEAGLKEPRSKRVELDSSKRAGKSQQPPSRAIGKTRAERPVKRAKGVPLSKLILVKKLKTALPKHPLPFAAKNMYYDERWQDKQERGFVHWLNFVLTPADEYALATTKAKVDARSIAFDGSAVKVAPRLAPTKEVLSFRAYAARRRLNHLRRASCRLFQSEAVVRVVCRLELEVEQRRLAVRTDRMIHADIGIKQKILDMLLSYNPLWLRIGLETVYGEVLPVQSNNDVIGMSRFILTRLLTSPDISAQFSHATVPHLYHDGYADAVAQHTMKKFLVLVYLLDCAKQSRLIAHDPCLFCKDAEIKSSKGMLTQFSRDYLSGEGDITKHLAYMGYVVTHVQTPLDEFDYAVTNLCTDLRDGLRLGRIVMLLSGDWSFASSLRAPAISRLQKIHNVELVFKQLTQRGFDLNTAKGGTLNARDIVDGHREKTLAFLWKLIFLFQTMAMLNEDELQEEVDMLERTLRVKLCMQRLLSRTHLTETLARRDSGGVTVAMDNPLTQLLLKWCRTVCLHYGVKVENFTVSFSDGRALCCLLHHYHPSLLPLHNIHFHTSQSVQEAAENEEDGTFDEEAELSQDWGTNQFGGEMDQSLFEKLLANEKENFKTLYEKVSELGGIPLMLKASDMCNTIPDERVVVTYVSYMCSRLLDLREETRAARIIQLGWRRFCLRRSARMRQKQMAACIVIQRAWREYHAIKTEQTQETAAVCLQAAWRGRRARVRTNLLKMAKQDSLLHRAATTIQTSARCFLAKQRLCRQKQSALTIQWWLRAHTARQAFNRKRQACRLIQSRYRAHSKGATVRKQFLQAKQSATVIQRAYRQKRERQREEGDRAACTLQSAWKGRKCRREFVRQRQAATCIQAWWKADRAQTGFLMQKTAATIIQRQFRAVKLGAEVRQEFQQKRCSAVTLQKHIRGSQQRKQFLQQKRSALVIQKHFRCYKYSVKYRALRLAAVILQRAVRAHQSRNTARQQYINIKQAAVIIQRAVRAHQSRNSARQQYINMKQAAVILQQAVRAHQSRNSARQQYINIKQAAVVIQRAVRAHQSRNSARQQYINIKQAAVVIQRAVRAHQSRNSARQQYINIKQAAVIIQRAVRAHQSRNSARQQYINIKQAAVIIQRAVRAHQSRNSARQQYINIKQAAVVIQRWFLQQKEKREARKQAAVVLIQAFIRGHLARREAEALRMAARREAAALVIQVAYRTLKAFRKLEALRLEGRREAAALVIQTAYRTLKACRKLEALHLEARREGAALVIQTAYRSRTARRQLEALRREARRNKAALTMQAYFRGSVARREARLLRMEALRELFAVRIQSAYRRYRAVKMLRALQLEARRQAAAVKIQSCYRRYLAVKEVRALRQEAMRHLSAVRIQTVYRMHRARRQVSALREAARREKAATKIQAWVRGYHQWGRYNTLQRSVIVLQAHVRGQQARRKYQEMKQVLTMLADYQQTHDRFQAVVADLLRRWNSAVAVQKYWRGHKQRQSFLETKYAATQLQAAARGRAVRKSYLLMVKSVTVVQRRFRARRIGQATRLQYQLMLGAAVVIQSSWKAYVVRSYYLQLRSRVVLAQSHCRGFLEQRRFQRQRQAAVCLQRRFRAKLLCGEAARDYQRFRQTVIQLQARARGCQQRQYFLRLRQASVAIQTAVRRWSAQRRYQAQRQAAVTLQRRWRSSLQCRQEVERYTLTKKAVTCIQAWVRGHLARKRVHGLHRAATLIQQDFRRHQARQRFLRTKHAVTTLQRHIRAFLSGRQQQKEFASTRTACVTIQSAYRGWVARQRFIKVRGSTVKIQSAVRGFQQRRRYQAVRRAAIDCQRHYRAKCLGQIFRAAFLMIRDAAVVIQKHARGHIARQEYQHQKSAALIVQAHTRGWLQRKEYAQKKQAVICIQRWLRAKNSVAAVRADFLCKRQAVVTLQTAWREHHHRQEERRNFAATVIQKHYRRAVQQKKYSKDVERVVRLQACMRGCLVRRSSTVTKEAVLKIQRRWRETLLTRQIRRNFLLKVGAAVVIQSLYRGHQTRIYYNMAVHRVILLQAVFRGCVQRQRYQTLRQTIIQLQRNVRSNALCRQERSSFLEKRQSVVCIQQAFRRWQARAKQAKIQAAVCIQSYARMLPVRREFLCTKKAVITLQSAARGHHARQMLHKKKSAILLIQNRVRFFLLVRHLQLEVHKQRCAAVKIQQAFRKHQARLLARKTQAACKIQATFRGFVQRQDFLRKKQATLTLQSAFRGRRDRRLAEQKRRRVGAALTLQRCFRAWKVRQLEKKKQAQRAEFLQRFVAVVRRHVAVVTIQRWHRRCVMMRQAQRQLHYIVLLQRHVRAFLQRVRFLRARQEAQERRERQERAATLIQSAVRKWLIGQKEKRRVKQITMVQALWRGRRLRRSLTSKKIAAARRRVQEANDKATEDKKLRNRTTSALDFLLNYKQLAYILDALMHLDVATRLSWRCCERLVEVNAVDVIYRLILSCNRSLPHMELIKYSVSVLLNLAKYEKTASAVYDAEDSVSTLVDLMSIYRDKGGAIFTKICMLLAILGSEGHRKQEMCRDKRLVDKLQSIHALVLRKHRMQVTRARMVARTSLNATLPSRLHGPKVAKVRPAWVLRRDSLHEIEDPLAALSFLLDTLHIGPK